jgi:hypothetical protein
VAASIDEYLDRRDWRIAANANQGYSLGGLILNTSGKMIANYWLSHVYPPEVGRAHRDGDIHIHDLDMLAGYCAGWSLRTLLAEGLNGVPGKVESAPPRHMSSAIGQIVPGNGSDNRVPQTQRLGRPGDAVRFFRIRRGKGSGLHRAEPAVARAPVPQNQKGGGFLAEAFPDVGALGLLADRVQSAVLYEGPHVFVGRTGGQAPLEPRGLPAGTGGLR